MAVKPDSRRAKRFTSEDIEEIAQLNAKRLSDAEACELLGIKYMSFAKWKSKERNNCKLKEAISRARAIKLEACIKAIDEAGDAATVTINGKEYEKRGDWRAKAWIAEQVLAPERFGQRHEAQSGQQPSIPLEDIAKALQIAMSRVQSSSMAADAVTDATVIETKILPDSQQTAAQH